MGSEGDNDIPGSGAVFTFGASFFADNLPSHFFIRSDPIIDLACGDEHTMVICQNGRLFGFGSNEYGQIGLGHKNNVVKPSCVKSLKPDKVKLIACGKYHTLAYTETGKLYSWGANHDGQLGLGDEVDSEAECTPSLVDCGVLCATDIVQLGAGASHSIALTYDGNVYVWGSNIEGQLGLGDGVKKTKSPTLLPVKEIIVQIACGLNHTLLLTGQGSVLVFGSGESGKLGLGGKNSVPLPIPISFDAEPNQVIAISAGGHHSMALTEEGIIYGWGENSSQQLGIPADECKDVNRPTIVTSLSTLNIKHVICGDKHSAFITEKEELYMCGENEHGKLCANDVKTDLPSETTLSRCLPFKISKFDGLKVKQVACGGKQTMVLASPEKVDITNDHNDNISEVSTHTSVNSNIKNNIINNSLTSNLSPPDNRDIMSPPPKTNSSASLHSLLVPKSNNTQNNPSNKSSHSQIKIPEGCPSPDKLSSLHQNSPNSSIKSNNVQEMQNNVVEITDVISLENSSTSSLSSTQKTDVSMIKNNGNNYSRSLSSHYGKENCSSKNNSNCKSKTRSSKFSSKNSSISYEDEQNRLLCMCINNYKQNTEDISGELKNGENVCRKTCQINNFVNNVINNQFAKNSGLIKDYEDKIIELNDHCNMYSNRIDYVNHVHLKELSEIRDCLHMEPCETHWTNDDLNNLEMDEEEDNDNFNHCHSEKSRNTHNSCNTESCQTHCSDVSRNHKTNSNKKSNFSDHISCKSGSNYKNHCHTNKSLDSSNSNSVESCQTHHSEVASGDHTINSNNRSVFNDRVSNESGSNYQNHCHTKRSDVSGNSNITESSQTEGASGDHKTDSNKNSDFNDQMSYESKSSYKNQCHSKKSYDPNKTYDKELYKTHSSDSLSENHQYKNQCHSKKSYDPNKTYDKESYKTHSSGSLSENHQHKNQCHSKKSYDPNKTYDKESYKTHSSGNLSENHQYKNQCHSKKSYDPNKTYDKESYKTHYSGNLSENHQTNSDNENKSNYHCRSESESTYKQHCSKKLSGSDNHFTDSCQTHRIDNIIDKQHANSKNKSDSHIHLAHESVGRSSHNANFIEQPDSNDYKIQQSDDEEEHIIAYNSKKAHIKQEIKKLEKNLLYLSQIVHVDKNCDKDVDNIIHDDDNDLHCCNECVCSCRNHQSNEYDCCTTHLVINNNHNNQTYCNCALIASNFCCCQQIESDQRKTKKKFRNKERHFCSDDHDKRCSTACCNNECEETQKQEIIERWLERNERKELNWSEHNRNRRDNEVRIKSCKKSKGFIEINVDEDSEDSFKAKKGERVVVVEQYGKIIGGMTNSIQKRFSLQKKSNSDRINSSTDQVVNEASEELDNSQVINSPKEVKSESMLLRIFGSKKTQAKNGHSSPNNNVQQNDSGTNGSCDTDKEDDKTKTTDKKSNCVANGGPSCGVRRGHQKNSKMCHIL